MKSEETTTSVANHTLTCEISRGAEALFILAYSLLFFSSLVLNCITLHVHFCTNLLAESSIIIYMKNLATADFFLCLYLITEIASHAYPSEMFKISCSFGATAFYINMYASILFMGLIAGNRYLKIAQPLENHYVLTVRSARYISAAIWFFLLIMSSIFLILFYDWNDEYDNETTFCESTDKFKETPTYMYIHYVTTVVVIFVLVSLILIYFKTHQKFRQIQLSRQTQFLDEKFRKAKRIMLLIVVIFCVCFVPYHLVNLLQVYITPLKNCTQQLIFYYVKEMTALFATINVFFDPIIYFFLSKAFREKLNFSKDGLYAHLSMFLSCFFGCIPFLKKWVYKD